MKKNLFWKMAATALLCAVIVTSCKDIIIDLEETTNITTPQNGYGILLKHRKDRDSLTYSFPAVYGIWLLEDIIRKATRRIRQKRWFPLRKMT